MGGSDQEKGNRGGSGNGGGKEKRCSIRMKGIVRTTAGSGVETGVLSAKGKRPAGGWEKKP